MKLAQFLGLSLLVAVGGTSASKSQYPDQKVRQRPQVGCTSRNLHAVIPVQRARCQVVHNVNNSDISMTGFAQDYKTVLLPSGTTYRYVHIRPKHRDDHYILFLHGFPSSAYDWRHQINYFRNKGYGIIAPDPLGYGGTDKPAQVEAYRAKKMAAEMIEILDCERVHKVFSVSHDWGTFLQSRLANYFPERFKKFAFLTVGHSYPKTPLNTDAIREAIKNSIETLGYGIVGYWLFFAEPDAASVIDSHTDAFFSILYTSEPSIWKTDFAPEGALRRFLTEDRRAPESDYYTPEEKSIHDRIFAFNGGYGPALNWYKVQLDGLNEIDEQDVPESRYVIHKPVLLLSASQDVVSLAEPTENQTRAYTTDLRIKRLDAGHWLPLEARDEVNRELENFFLEPEQGKCED
ncbi:MAG: hypothetical protein M1816_006320 [Peltula sp. TS41687]|nr:MAG: hypothetical protein M1816_006320 [Peltula sp. TS41687]